MPEIAIVGCGAAGVTFLRSFVAQIINHKINVAITIFEKRDSKGGGIAYQPDLKNLLLNRPLQKMSATIDDNAEFEKWLLAHPEYTSEIIVEADGPDDKRAYTSREIFGHYLSSVLAETIEKAEKLGIKITLIPYEAIQIHAEKPYAIEAGNGETYFADYLVLCSGNNKPRDIYHLKESPRYINDPYPLHQTLTHIQKHETIS